MASDHPLISAIGAVASNGTIGLDGWLPWDIPDELAYFEATVAGAALVIGRLTYESMAVVPDDSFVVSRAPMLAVRPGCRRVDSVENGIRDALKTGKPVFVIGGASVYAAAWRYCHRFYLTRIERPFDGDSNFPATIDFSGWSVESESSRLLRENKSGQDVVCRFIVYRQTVPLLLPDAAGR